MEPRTQSDNAQIKRGRVQLLIAIALILIFGGGGLVNGLRTGQPIPELVGFLALWGLPCFFLYQGSAAAKSWLGCLLTLMLLVLSFAFLCVVGCWTTPELRKEVSAPSFVWLIAFLAPFAGLVYCWWALRFSKSVKAFLAFQQSRRRSREL